MTKDSAKRFGFCKHCAAFDKNRQEQRCGAVKRDPINCLLDKETIERWRSEHGLCGTVRSSPAKEAFGKSEHIKRRRGAWGKSKYKGE